MTGKNHQSQSTGRMHQQAIEQGVCLRRVDAMIIVEHQYQ
jgi:hypothetical protein